VRVARSREPVVTIEQIGEVLGVSRTTMYRALRRENESVAGRRGKSGGGPTERSVELAGEYDRLGVEGRR